MKKFPVFFLLVFISMSLPAQDDQNDVDDFALNMWEPEDMEDMEDEKEPGEPAGFRLKNRMVELSIANVSFDVSNDFISAADIFRSPFYILWNIKKIQQDPVLVYRDKIVINLDDFLNGFKFNFGAVIKPLSLNFNRNDKWGFGLDIGHISAMGNVSLAGNMLTLKETKKEEFGVGAAVFADVGIPVFFHVNEFKIKIRPAVYVPVFYTEPGGIYTGREGTYFEINYNQRIYSLVEINADDIMQDLKNNARDIPQNNLGYDLRLCVEYPWDYDLDIGVDIVNIPVPFATAKLYHYSEFTGKAFLDVDSIDLIDMVNNGKIPENAYGYPDNFEIKHGGYNSNGKNIYRPFLMLFYANYRPLDSRNFSLIPSLGFSLNRLYQRIFALEGGLSARFDLANMFIPVIGIHYNDRKWKNSIDFAFNFRAFEFDFGLSMQSQNFRKSFRGAGLGVNFGIKLGW